MLIKTLQMKNFRQFKGETKINFSIDTEKNVTVILGDNTFGKTTLLQAFNWCLYGNVNFPNNDKNLLNYEIASTMENRDAIEVEVEITLEHGNLEYILTRTQTYRCMGGKISGDAVPKINLSRKMEDGQTKAIEEKKIRETINKILPEGLSTYFFFDTERISTVSERKDIGKAIKDFLGLSVIENASRHLGDRSKKTSVIGQIYASMDLDGDAKAQTALDKIQTAIDTLDEISKRLEDCNSQIDHFNSSKEEIENKLRAHQSTTQLQKEKDRLEEKIQFDRKTLESDIEKYFQEFSEGSLSFFTQPLLKIAENFLQAVKIDDKGVQDITRQSIMELIKRGRCICGREICEGSDAYQHLMDEIRYVPPESIGNTVRRYREQIKNFSDSYERNFERIEEAYKRIGFDKARIEDQEYELEEKRKKIAGLEDMSQYEEQLADIRKRLRELESKKEKFFRDQGSQENIIKTNQKIYDGLTLRSQKNRENRMLLKYAEALKAWVEPESQKQSRELLRKLTDEVNQIFGKMYHGHRRVNIDEKYHVDLFATVDNREIVSGESEGANRVKNFAFIAGLVSLAKKQILKDLGISSESYPLVMDAPFSNADEEHTTRISKVLPEIANQIIMFVMQKDWNYAEQVMNHRVGKKYLLKKFSETFTKIEEA